VADWDDDRDSGRRQRREPAFDMGERARRGDIALEPDDRPGPSDRVRRSRNARREPDFSPPFEIDDEGDDHPRRPRRAVSQDRPEPAMSRRRRDEDYDDHDDGYDPPPPPRRARAPERTERREASRERRPAPRRSFGRRLVYWSAVASVWGIIACAVLVGYHALKLPPIDQLAVPKRPPNIAILAADGTLIANRGETGGSNIPISDLPKHVPNAFIAIEDKRFREHFGIDVIALGRAVMRNMTSGKVEQGGSTLTQQLAKNLFLTQERTMSRKVQEAILALWLERHYRKDQILELYLNRVYFGAGAYGIDAAAQRYFGKSARSLTLGEAAMLAGLMKSPSRLAPSRNPQGASDRAMVVLKEMLDQGYISPHQAKVAMATKVEARRTIGGGSANYAADWVMDVLDDYVGAIDGDVQVTTTLLPPIQQAAERALTSALHAQGDAKNVDQGAIVAMAPDGAIRALVGGRDYTESQFNRAVLARRQPGSSFKPFVYLAALELGLTPETVREDGPVNIKGWQPENYTREYFGNVTLLRALAMSLNTVAVKLGQEAGIKNVVRTAQRLGINSPLAAHPSLPLGTSEVTPLEMVTAYTAFANGGVGVTPYVISRVRGTDGRVIFERKATTRGRVIEAHHVAQMNVMLRETLLSGTARKAEIPGWVAAGKTGTTQEHKDAWFVGYTGALTAAVWVGNDDGDPMKKVSGSGLPAEIWSRFMRSALAGQPVQPLPGIVGAAPAAREAAPARDYDPDARTSEDMRPPMPQPERTVARPVPRPVAAPREPAVERAPLQLRPESVGNTPRLVPPKPVGNLSNAPQERPRGPRRVVSAEREGTAFRQEVTGTTFRPVPPRPVGAVDKAQPKPDRTFYAGPNSNDRDQLNRLFGR